MHAMTGHVAKSEPDDLWSLHDLEYRAHEDDAWYSVYAVLDASAETLTVKYWCSPEEYEVVFAAADFATEAEVDKLVRRFRPVSVQMQDHECRNLSIGTTVCAAHGVGVEDLRFYDAVVETVKRQPHSFVNGEEECLCNFVLLWQHGRGLGTLTLAKIENICNIEPATELDHRISAFAIMAKKKITSSKPISTRKKGYVSIEKNSQKKRSLKDTTMTRKNLLSESEGRISNYNEWTSQDNDMGPSCYTAFILLGNLEKDLAPSSIETFIYKMTAILPQAIVFPRRLSDPFARGAIMVDSHKKAQIIHEFLKNPNHIIVSSRGRPWIITENALAGWNIIPMTLVRLDEIRSKRTDARNDEELQVVLSGTESYNRAKQLRDLFVEYINHESKLCKKLVLDQQKILLLCPPAK